MMQEEQHHFGMWTKKLEHSYHPHLYPKHIRRFTKDWAPNFFKNFPHHQKWNGAQNMMRSSIWSVKYGSGDKQKDDKGRAQRDQGDHGNQIFANAIPSPLQTHPELRKKLGYVPKLSPPSKKGTQKDSELKISKTHAIAIPNTSGASQKIEQCDKLPSIKKERAPNPKHCVKQHSVMWNVECGMWVRWHTKRWQRQGTAWSRRSWRHR